MYPVVFFDALRVKMRDQGTVRSKQDLSAALRTIYTAPDADLAVAALDQFAAGPWEATLSGHHG